MPFKNIIKAITGKSDDWIDEFNTDNDQFLDEKMDLSAKLKTPEKNTKRQRKTRSYAKTYPIKKSEPNETAGQIPESTVNENLLKSVKVEVSKDILPIKEVFKEAKAQNNQPEKKIEDAKPIVKVVEVEPKALIDSKVIQQEITKKEVELDQTVKKTRNDTKPIVIQKKSVKPIVKKIKPKIDVENFNFLQLLSSGAKKWNEWRLQNPDIRPNLKNADLRNKNLSFMLFDSVDFEGANLSKTLLWHTRFTNANLTGVDFSNADINYADFKDAIL